MLQRIDGRAPLPATAGDGAGAPATARDAQAVAPAIVGAQLAAQASADAVRTAVDNANRDLRAFTQSLEFEVDHDTHEVIVKLVDTQDGKVLRQVPSQEMLAIARALSRLQTQLVRGEA